MKVGKFGDRCCLSSAYEIVQVGLGDRDNENGVSRSKEQTFLEESASSLETPTSIFLTLPISKSQQNKKHRYIP